MFIKPLDPSGILRPEISGVKDLETLSDDWFGYSNLFVKFGRWDEPAEIDVVFVTHDRIFIVDLKNWTGKVTASNGAWFQQGESRGASAARKLAYQARRLAGLMDREVQLADKPFVEHRVLFTHPHCDIVGLEDQDRINGAMKMGDFLRSIRGKQNYDNAFRIRHDATWGYHRPLTAGEPKKLLMRFFGDKEHFQPRQLSFEGYRPKDLPSFSHPKGVYDEFECEYVDEPSYLALLRYWKFEALPTETRVAGERREVAAREHSVLGLIRRIDADLHDRGVLKWKANDREYNMRYWELFELERTMRRLREYLTATEMQRADRIDLASRILARVAQLHRHEIAHRDLGPHSIWIDQARSSVVLSAFGCAHYPATESLKDMRVRLVAASTKLPEDDETLGVRSGTPFQQDVFLAGALLWSILIPTQLPCVNGVPDVLSASDVTNEWEALLPWFRKALDLEPQERWKNAITMHDAFVDIVRHKAPAPQASTSFVAYQRENPYLTYRVSTPIKDDHATVYVSGTGNDALVVKIWSANDIESPASAAALRSFLQSAESLQAGRTPLVQQIEDFGIYRNDVFLVSRYAGVTLDEIMSRPMGIDAAYSVSCQLVEAVSGLHQYEIAHGDINLHNINIVEQGDLPQIVIIDVPSFRESDRSTPAYSPPIPTDAFGRDRFAACSIVRELLAICEAIPREHPATKLLQAIKDCEEGPEPWLTLQPLLAHIDGPRTPPEPNLRLTIGVSNRKHAGALLADDGVYRIVTSVDNRTLSIVGYDAAVEFAIDSDGRTPTSARIRHASEPFLNWTSKNAVASFTGTAQFYERGFLERRESEPVFALEKVQEALARLSPVVEPAQAPATAAAASPELIPAMRSIDVDMLWRKIIEVEEDDVLEAQVTGPVAFDRINALYVVPCQFSRSDIDFDMDDRPVVYMNEYRLGDVDPDRMTSTELPIKNVRGGMSLAPGVRLRIATVQDMDNFKRRKDAIERILDDKCLIPGLLQYFASATAAEPRNMRPEEIDETVLDRYELNDTQKVAFRRLWRYGPIGLLQGPPGTGKTKFIAAFVHYAITQGGINNVLLLSQSHKAVDNAIESLLRQFGDQPVSLIRVGQLAKVSQQVTHYHSRAVHEQYHDLFEAEAKQRVSRLARHLGLPEAYAREAFEFWSKLRAHESILSDPTAENDDDGHVRAQYSAAKDFVERLSEILKIDSTTPVQATFDALLPALAQTGEYNITNPELVRRFRQLLLLSREWLDALGGERTLEPFLVKSRQIVSGTCVGVGHRILRLDEVAFDLVVIDEAAKCGPGDLAIGLQVAKRALLVGDHKQLPPFQERSHFDRLVAELGNASAVRETDFQRALSSPYGSRASARLEAQYRMCPEIGGLVSTCFYDGAVTNERGDSPDYYALLPAPFGQPIAWLDTSDAGAAAREWKQGTSYANVAEASTIIRALKLLEGEVDFWKRYDSDRLSESEPIGIICMYAAQSTYLKREILTSGLSTGFQERIKVDTVDSYQGRENPFIIVSLSRNSPKGKITQHAGDFRRVNVALSRAMERLLIVGAAPFFRQDDPANSLYRVLSYIDEMDGQRVVPSSRVGNDEVA